MQDSSERGTVNGERELRGGPMVRPSSLVSRFLHDPLIAATPIFTVHRSPFTVHRSPFTVPLEALGRV